VAHRQSLTGAQAIIKTLRAFHINTIFGIPGVHTLALYDAMRDEAGLRHKRRFSGRYIATDVRPPDYVALAHAFHAQGLRAETPAALRDAISTAVHATGPTIIEVWLPSRRW
jgi:thiamine pyrophosphate-dependent acetolactate synthase large subunit-like protein